MTVAGSATWTADVLDTAADVIEQRTQAIERGETVQPFNPATYLRAWAAELRKESTP